MDIMDIMKERHAVRQYTDTPLSSDDVAALEREIAACNEEGNLHMQLVVNDPAAFDSMLAHYGKFDNVRNYLALVGKKAPDLEERCGYYGERVVLLAQKLGLNTCWVALTFSKRAARKMLDIGADEKLVLVVALGHGATQGTPHKSKPIEQLCQVDATMPDWFARGMEAAALAPTAVNQQKFLFTLADGTAHAKSLGGSYANVDLGIVKYHFEAASGHKVE